MCSDLQVRRDDSVPITPSAYIKPVDQPPLTTEGDPPRRTWELWSHFLAELSHTLCYWQPDELGTKSGVGVDSSNRMHQSRLIDRQIVSRRSVLKSLTLRWPGFEHFKMLMSPIETSSLFNLSENNTGEPRARRSKKNYAILKTNQIKWAVGRQLWLKANTPIDFTTHFVFVFFISTIEV